MLKFYGTDSTERHKTSKIHNKGWAFGLMVKIPVEMPKSYIGVYGLEY